jgi:outer membrane receptor protein involved in Fe transport
MTNQFRLVGSGREDHYQVPNTVGQDALGIRDEEKATDAFLNTTWVHTTQGGLLITVSPYYHFNRGQYIGGSSDPLVTMDNRGSHYAGGYVNVSQTKGRHTYHYGTDTFAEHDDSLFGLSSNVGNRLSLTHEEVLWANVASAFAEETFRVAPNFTLNGGVRAERFSGTLAEHAVSPRAGMAWQIGHGAVLRASYGRFYKHPQTSTVTGPQLRFALQEGFGYLPVPGERDQMAEVGLGIPVHGWTLDFDGFYNKTKNLVDHEVLGNSNLLFPLTIANGRVRAFESTLKSPLIVRVVRLHYTLSLQSAQGRGAITGGLTDFVPPPKNAYFYLDHDQRITFTPGAELTLPRSAWASASITYGSGFLRGNGPDHMPQHTTLDVAAGKDMGHNLEVRFSALNVTDALFLTGFENSFAGTHYANPREITGQLKVKFHY